MRVIFGVLIAVASAVGAFGPSGATAAVGGPISRRRAADRALQLSSPVLAPMAFSRFCLRYRDDCEIHRLRDASGLTRARWARWRGSTPRSTAPSRRKRTTATSSTRPGASPPPPASATITPSPSVTNSFNWDGRRARCCSPRSSPAGASTTSCWWCARAPAISSPTTSTRACGLERRPYRWVKIQTPENPPVPVDGESDPTTTAEPSLASASGQDTDDTLVAADATEIALADEQRDATDVVLTLEAPTQRYASRRRSRAGLVFARRAGVAHLKAFTPTKPAADESCRLPFRGRLPISRHFEWRKPAKSRKFPIRRPYRTNSWESRRHAVSAACCSPR